MQVVPARAITLRGASQADAEALATLRVHAMRESLEQLGRCHSGRARTRFLSSFEPSFTRHIVQVLSHRVALKDSIQTAGGAWILPSDHRAVTAQIVGQ